MIGEKQIDISKVMDRSDRKSMKFVAPEIFRNEPVTDKSDVYTLGALYYYMLYG